jgi:hypothetical protein
MRVVYSDGLTVRQGDFGSLQGMRKRPRGASEARTRADLLELARK